jgi:hypothetical protein
MPRTLDDFAGQVTAAAREIGGRKVLISRIWDALGFPDWERFREDLLLCHRHGMLVLQRADLRGAIDPDDLEASTVVDERGGAEYQYVVLENARAGAKRNPARGGKLEALDPEEVERAAEMYEKFHRLPVNKVDVDLEMEMPTHVTKVGRATHVMYRSGKVDPETGRKPRAPQNYIHDHDAGVDLYEPGAGDIEVPRAIAAAQGLVRLGHCLGLGYIDPDDGERYEMEGGRPLPELYCTPDGKALVIVEAKREILFVVWGGALGVEPRGIVG